MKLFTSPEKINFNLKNKIFLAGTIDNGNSYDWQQHVIDEMKDYNVTLLNPRRKVWNHDHLAKWPELQNKELENQINWELEALDNCDLIFMYFADNSLSPISLLELGLYIEKKPIICACSDLYFRYTNVKAVCTKFGVEVFVSLNYAIRELKYIC